VVGVWGLSRLTRWGGNQHEGVETRREGRCLSAWMGRSTCTTSKTTVWHALAFYRWQGSGIPVLTFLKRLEGVLWEQATYYESQIFHFL